MDMVSGIARASMDMASARVATAVQIGVLKQVMEVQKETMALLLDAFGIGKNLNVQG